MWNTEQEEIFVEKTGTFYDKEGAFYKEKTIASLDHVKRINQWIKQFDRKSDCIGFMGNPSPDFQHCSQLYIANKKGIEHFNFYHIVAENLLAGCIYLAVRFCIPANWDNDRDQFLYPNDGWASDTEFQNDCLVFTLFHGQNRISSSEGVNHWIPFSEAEVGAQDAFKSHFMHDFIRGKLPKAEVTAESQLQIFNVDTPRPHTGEPLAFSPEATAAMDAGRALWQYYHRQPGALSDASLYDIRLHFQGVKTSKSGKTQMNTTSSDDTYTALIKDLRARVAALARKIEPKVYAYGFLK